ncbi:thioredoxin family protein [Streptomyces sp. NPDC058572]|uniref:thioredoxin family protein n=1 Tax=Streptomyces sp. NPDC058572 TaxID=3346546 RepID=UPI003646DC9F
MSPRKQRAARHRRTTTRVPSPAIAGAAVITIAVVATWAGGQSPDQSSAGRSVVDNSSPQPFVPADEDSTPELLPSASSVTRPAATASSAKPDATASASKAARKPAAKTSSAPVPMKKSSSAPSAGKPFTKGYGTGDAQKAVDAALRSAAADGKSILLDFGANWCGNCKAADEAFARSATSDILSDSYHVVKVDIGSQNSDNFSLLRKYSSEGGRSYKMPVLIVLDSSGSVRTDTHRTGNPSLTVEGLSSWLRQWV